MDKKYKIILVSVLAVVLVVMVYSYSQLPFYPPDYPSGPNLTAGDRLLVVAPHPDDEVICNGGVIRYAVEHNIPVKVVVVTDGNDSKTSPLTRHNETINGTKALGLSENDVTFLGYKDGSLQNLLNENWYYTNPFTSSEGLTHTNYPYAFQANATYCGANLEGNLETVMGEFKPTVVIYPSGDDQQLDHQATSGFMDYTLTKLQFNGAKYTYLLHLPPNWPVPRTYYSEYYLYPPKEFVGLKNGAEWSVFNLNSFQERIKEESFLAYKTQITPSSYLWSFLRKNELFAQYSQLNISANSNQNITNSSNYSNDPNYIPTPLFNDAKGDVNGKKHESLDITSVGMDINSASSWLSIGTLESPSPSGVYSIKLKVIKPSRTEMVKIKVENGTGQMEINNNGNPTAESVPVLIKNNNILVEIPPSIFNESPYFLISVDSSLNSQIIDQTPWRTVKFT